MKHLILGLASLLAASTPALAASLIVWPQDATTQDSLVLEVQAAPPCATVDPDAVQFVREGVILVPFDDGSRVLCTRPNPCPLRIPLGRLPAGEYSVEFVPDRLSLTNAVATTVTVYPSLVPDMPIAHNFPRARRSQRHRGAFECPYNSTQFNRTQEYR